MVKPSDKGLIVNQQGNWFPF